MRFYRGNKADAGFDADINDVAQQFWASPMGTCQMTGETQWPLERALRSFLTHPKYFNSVWEDEDEFDQLFEAVYALRPWKEKYTPRRPSRVNGTA